MKELHRPQHVIWDLRRSRCCSTVPRSAERGPWGRPGRGRSAWARRSPHPAPKCPPLAGLGVAGSPPRSRRCLPRGAGLRWGGTAEHRGCAGGRPRRGGTPVPDEPVPAGCLRNCPVAPTLRRTVTTGSSPCTRRDVLVHGREARRASRRAPTESVDLPPGHRGTAAREALPAHPRTGGHARRSGRGRESCISNRPTRAAVEDRANPANPRCAAPGRHDPIQRLPTAVPTTTSTRHSGSCARRSRIAVVHGRRRSHGRPRQRIMCSASAGTGRRQRRTPMITKSRCSSAQETERPKIVLRGPLRCRRGGASGCGAVVAPG
jgi:hypothetical protein